MSLTLDGFSDRARNVFAAGRSYAADLQSRRVTTAHVAAALVSEQGGTVEQLLRKLGADPDRLARRLNSELGRLPRTSGRPEFEGAVASLISHARQIAGDRDESPVATHHLLLALVDGSYGLARRALQEAGVTRTASEYMLRTLQSAVAEETATPSRSRRANSDAASSRGDVQADPSRTSLNEFEVLGEFGRDLTELARDNQLDPLIGRDLELRRIMQILGRRSKNNPILVGEPGVGKSTIARGFASRIAAGDVPERLADTQIVQLDLGGMVAGTSLRGQFEERLKKLVREVAETNGRVILFVDEIHNLVTTGGRGGSGGAAELLKPALSRGEISIIGTTTPAEYRKHIESDKALERRFQEIHVDAPDEQESVRILRGIKEKYEIHHGVKIADNALSAAVRLSDRYVTDRNLPDKAIDLIDEAASMLRLEFDSEPVEIDELRRALVNLEVEKETVASRKGPAWDDLVQREEKASTRLTELESRLTREKDVHAEINRLRAELDATNKLVEKAQQENDLGRAAELKYAVIKELESELEAAEKRAADLTGDGALLRDEVTEEDVATVVAGWTGVPVNRMLQSEREKLLRMEDELGRRVVGQQPAVEAIASAVRRSRAGVQSANRPIGNFFFVGPTGVGKTELAKALADYMFDSEESLIRIDMSEYMEQSKVNTLIGAAYGYVDSDKGGVLTEAVRRRPYSIVLFDEAEKAHPDVFNILLQVLDEGRLTDSQGRLVDFTNTIIIMTSNVGARQILDLTGEVSYEELDIRVHEILQDAFRPEFLNRLDDTVVFNALDRDSLGKILEILLRGLQRLLAEQGLAIELTDDAKEYLVEEGYEPEYGARPLKRALLREVQDPLAIDILEGEFGPGDVIVADVSDDGLILEFTKKDES